MTAATSPVSADRPITQSQLEDLKRTLLESMREKLLTAAECADVLGVHVNQWPPYWKQHTDLARACRRVRVKPGSKGRRRWLRSAVLRHVVDSEACR